MGNTLAAIRARLQAAENKNTKQFDNANYPFWNIPTGSSCRVRFVPDGDTKNDFFWVEKLVIKLPFVGVKGANNNKPVTVQVPCVEMWPADFPQGCPILTEVRVWYKDESMKETANKYWKKKSYITQGFVRDNPLKEENPPENPIRRFTLGSQIFNIIKAHCINAENENIPTDYVNGTDLLITKSMKGEYADYSSSAFSRKDSALTSDELAAIEKYPLSNLSDFLPKKPTEIELKVIKELFEASVEGELYDPAKWGQYYKPFGLESEEKADTAGSKTETETKAATVRHSAPAEQKTEHKSETVQTEVPSSKTRANDILARIQNRNREAK